MGVDEIPRKYIGIKAIALEYSLENVQQVTIG